MMESKQLANGNLDGDCGEGGIDEEGESGRERMEDEEMAESGEKEDCGRTEKPNKRMICKMPVSIIEAPSYSISSPSHSCSCLYLVLKLLNVLTRLLRGLFYSCSALFPNQCFPITFFKRNLSILDGKQGENQEEGGGGGSKKIVE